MYICIPLDAITRLEKGHIVFFLAGQVAELSDRRLYHLSSGRGEQGSSAECWLFSLLAFQ
jgi:hypothetical protein